MSLSSDLDLPLLKYLDGATHVQIQCASILHCSYRTVWLTSRLVEAMPRAKTLRDFQNCLRCTKCHTRGWTTITPARR